MRKQIVLLAIGLLLAAPGAQAGPLHDAARKGDVAAIAAALDAGADVNEYNGLSTPVILAVRRGHYAAAKLLIARGANVNAVSEYWGEPLMMAAVQSRADLMKLLLANGAIPDSTHDGETALHVAARMGCLDCVKALAEAMDGINVVYFAGTGCMLGDRTPLHLARRYGFEDVADYLIAHGAEVPRPPPIGRHLAEADAESGRVSFVSYCAGCHLAEPDGRRMQGPHLWGIVGRDKAALADSNYSRVLQAWDGVWTYEDLNTLLYGPTLTMPGVSMETPGIVGEAARADLIAYLRTLSHTPAPLPLQ